MELWIRSQDKLRLAKIESVIINYNMQTEILGNCYSADGIEKDIPLGEYASKERAIEVLDEIQNILATEWDFKDKFSMCRVYEMPKE